MSTYEFETKHINTHCSRNSFDKAILPTAGWEKTREPGSRAPSQLGTSRKDFAISRKDFGISRNNFRISRNFFEFSQTY